MSTLARPAVVESRRPPARFRHALRHPDRLTIMVLTTYAGSRVVTTALFAVVVHFARFGSRIGQHASWVDVVTAWDGQWYWLIARSGYPAHLPLIAGGTAQNAWAFLPAYPKLAAALTFGQTAWWPVAAAAVSTLAGAIAALLLAAWLRPHTGRRGAMIAALLFSVSPVSFLLQVAYAEALSLALMFGILLLIDRGRYLSAIPVVLVLAFTRPGVQALALLCLLLLLTRLVQHRRKRQHLPVRDALGLLALAAVAAVSGWFWPWVAASVTGNPDAYLRSELAWRNIWSGSTFTPVTSWFYGADFWFGRTLGPVVLGVVLAAWAALLLSKHTRRIGTTAMLWCGAWSVYLLVVFFPQSSLFRLLMPLAPIGGVLRSAQNRTVAVIVVVSIGLQGLWMFCLYGYWTHYWTVP